MANSQRDVAKEQYWREVLARQAQSGLTVRTFCLEQKLSEPSFHAWRRTIRARDGLSGPSAKPCPAGDDSSPPPTFVPVRVTGSARGEEWIQLDLVGGHVLRLPLSTAPTMLVELVVGLAAARRSP